MRIPKFLWRPGDALFDALGRWGLYRIPGVCHLSCWFGRRGEPRGVTHIQLTAQDLIEMCERAGVPRREEPPNG